MPEFQNSTNVFDISQAVAIHAYVRRPHGSSETRYAEIWGSRESKYAYLTSHSVASTEWAATSPDAEYCSFLAHEDTDALESTRLDDVFLKFGAGIKTAGMLGSEWNDQPFVEGGKVRFRTNNCGGFLGGMSNGEDLLMRVGVKPTPTISKEQDTVDMTTLEEKKLEAITRRDISILPRIYPVAEAMIAIAIVDALFMARGWYGLAHLDEKWVNLTEPRNKGEYTI